MKVENTDQASTPGSACHYDWNAAIAAEALPERRAVLDRATDLYRFVEAGAVKAIPAMRKLAVPTAALMVIAGLGVGTTLLYDPPAIREAAALASMEARAEPEAPVVVAETQPEPDVIQGVPVPSTANTSTPAATANTDTAHDVATADPADAVAAETRPELGYQPDRATMTGSIPAAVLAAAMKDTKKTTKAAEPVAAADETATRKGQIRSAVNMRASPHKGAKVLTVVPAKTSVSVIECKSWCKIAFDGREGFVYKSYVR